MLAHAFSADRKTDIDATGRNLVGDALDGKQAGGAPTADDRGRRGGGEAGGESSAARDVVGAGFEDGAEGDFFDESWVEVGAGVDAL